jgi:hypothetical protein
MSRRRVWVWRDVWPLLRRVVESSGLPLNRVVNLALLQYLGGVVTEEELQLEARKVGLMREEADIRRSWRLIGRSGSYLEGYAAQVLQPQEYREYQKVMRRDVVGAEYSDERRGRIPLKALSKKEERLFRKMMARREEIAKELTEIELRLFELRKVPKRNWRWKFNRRVKRTREYKKQARKQCPGTEKQEVDK